MKPIKTLLALQVALLALLAAPAGAAPPLPRGPEIKVSTNTASWHYDPSVAVFPDGGFVVVFMAGPREDEPGRRVIHARLFDRQGRPTSGQFRLIDRVAGSQFVDQVIADRDGSFLVVWTETAGPRPLSRRSVFVRRFNRDGTPRGKRIMVHAPSSLDRLDGVITIAPDGRFVVAWSATALQAPGQGYTNAMARVFSPRGEPLSDEFLVLEGDYGIGDDTLHAAPLGVAVGLDGAMSFLIQTYEITGSIYTDLVRFSPEGEIEVTPINATGCCLYDAFGGGLAMSRDGSLMVTWAEEQITARRFTREGDEANDFIVTPYFTERQTMPVIAQHADGSFVIVWVDGDTSDHGVFGRTFTANGTPLTGRYRINKTVEGDQWGAAIAASRQGPTVVVWQQIAEDGRADIFARLVKE